MLFFLLISLLSFINLDANAIKFMGRRTKVLDAIASITGKPDDIYTFTPLKGEMSLLSLK